MHNIIRQQLDFLNVRFILLFRIGCRQIRIKKGDCESIIILLIYFLIIYIFKCRYVFFS